MGMALGGIAIDIILNRIYQTKNAMIGAIAESSNLLSIAKGLERSCTIMTYVTGFSGNIDSFVNFGGVGRNDNSAQLIIDSDTFNAGFGTNSFNNFVDILSSIKEHRIACRFFNQIADIISRFVFHTG
jgi:hypothetical protein